MKKIIFKSTISLLLVLSIILTPIVTGNYAQVNANEVSEPIPAAPDLKILEIQPGTSYDLSSETINALKSDLGNRNVTVRQMSMKEFVSNVETVNGLYDIVYIGNNKSDGDIYIADFSPSLLSTNYTSGTPEYIRQIKGLGNNHDVDAMRQEYYSGNDITNLAASKIVEFIESGQLTIIDGAIVGTELVSTKIYNNFQPLVSEYENIRIHTQTTTGTVSNQIDNLEGHYFDGMNFKTSRGTRKDTKIDFDWGTGIPKSNVSKDSFSVRWTGSITAAVTGTYTFTTETDDGSKLWINNKLIIDDWVNHARQTKTGTINLVQGQTYPVKMEYFENSGSAFAKLTYTMPSSSNGITLLDHLKAYTSTQIAKRPILKMNSGPLQYNGNNSITGINKMLSYRFDTYDTNHPVSNMQVRLYIDGNGDGRFEPNEVVQTYMNSSNTNGFTINYMFPESITGLQPWKLELTDAKNAKTFITGATAFKGSPLVIRVLQLIPPNKNNPFKVINTFRIDNLAQNYLKKDGEYEIVVTTKTTTEFDNSYDNGSNPIWLNGHYDMIILGFADVYEGGHINNANALAEIQTFIDSKQSVMMTHDTISVGAYISSSWGGKQLTTMLRDQFGQNIYAPGYANQNTGKVSLGVAKWTLNRMLNIGRKDYFPTTTNVHKINENMVTQYPYVLGDINVATTHYQYFQLNLEDPEVIPVYTLKHADYNHFDGRNDYYTYTKGSLTYSGTGHVSPSTAGEYQMFINTILKASRGANQAPVVNITGLQDGQKISNTVDELNFNVVANDYEDSRLNIRIYMDKNNDGDFLDPGEMVYENLVVNHQGGIERGLATPFSLIKGIADGITQFKIKVEVVDSSNALGSQILTINHVDSPQITLSSTSNTGYLVGDTATIPIKINASQGLNNTNFFGNMNMLATVNPTYFTLRDKADWTETSGNTYGKVLSNVSYNAAGNPTPSTQTVNLKLKFEKATETNVQRSIPISVNYVDALDQQSAPYSLSADVKSGTIMTEFKYRETKGIQNVKVNITNGSNASQTDGDSKSNEFGLYEKNNLPTDSYTVKVDQSSINELNQKGYDVSGYRLYKYNGVTNKFDSYASGTIHEQTQAATTITMPLSYNAHNYKLVYDLGGSPIKDVSITSNRKNETILFYNQYNGNKVGSVKAEHGFRLIRSVTKLTMVSSSLPLNNFTFTGAKVYKDNVLMPALPFTLTKTADQKLKIVFDTTLDSGAYDVRFFVNYNGSESTNGVYTITFNEATINEAGLFDSYVSGFTPTSLRLSFEPHPLLLWKENNFNLTNQ